MSTAEVHSVILLQTLGEDEGTVVQTARERV